VQRRESLHLTGQLEAAAHQQRADTAPDRRPVVTDDAAWRNHHS